MDFADAMRAATQLTRAQKLMEATRIIQGALLLGRGQFRPSLRTSRSLRAKPSNNGLSISLRKSHNSNSRSRPGRWVTAPRRSISQASKLRS